MSPDDIDRIALGVFELLGDMGRALDEDDEWTQLHEFLCEKLDPFVTRDRNYN